MKTCKKHITDPVVVYRKCVGCELQALREECNKLKAETDELRNRIEDLSPFKAAPLTRPNFKCLACGDYHYGTPGLPCPKMRVTASLGSENENRSA
jgi:hypothetical protein